MSVVGVCVRDWRGNPFIAFAIDLLIKFGVAIKDCSKSPTRRETPKKLIFYGSCFFIETVRAMPAATFAAIAAFEVVFLGKAFVAFGCEIKIFAFDGFIFVILLVHLIQK